MSDLIKVRQDVESFFKHIGMHPESISPDKFIADFHSEIERGLAGQESSLASLPTYIGAPDKIPYGKRCVVIDAGGTNLRAGIVSFCKDQEPIIDSFEKVKMPGTGGKSVSKEDFFGTMADLVGPKLEEADSVGFCFSYPIEILPNKDGRLIHFTKEIKAPDVEGLTIGEELKKALSKKGYKSDFKIVLLNDTVAALLAGAGVSDKKYDNWIGYILGTGINSAYIEENRAIKKADNLLAGGSTIINLESGSFGKVEQGEADRQLDRQTAVPGSYKLEKMVSGGYFGQLAKETLLLAAQKGVIDKGLFKILSQEAVETKDVDNYLHNPYKQKSRFSQIINQFDEETQIKVFFIIDLLMERAALLAACHCGALFLRIGGGENPLKPFCASIDGTTFYANYRFRFRMERELEKILSPRGMTHYSIVKVNDAPVLGAAIAALIS